MSERTGVGLALVVLLAVGCGDGADAPPERVADWEGIPLGEAVAEPFGAEGAMEGAVEGPRAAEAGEDAGPDVFERVGGIARDGTGRVVVVASLADEIRVFGPDGAFHFAFGSGGDGRGELAGACCPAFGPDGLLWVRDRGNTRYQAFEVGEEGVEVRHVLSIRHSSPTLWAPTTFDDRGRLVDAGLMVDEQTRETRPVRVHMDRSTGEVEGVAGLPQPPEERMGRASVTSTADGRESTFYLYQPHGPRSLLVHGPGGRWAEAVSDTYAVRIMAPDGSMLIVRGPEGEGPPLTEDERADARETLEGYRERFELGEDEIPFEVPERKPPLRTLYFDQEGRLWVELNTAGGEREAHVYAPDGTPVARYTWPAEVLLDVRAWIGADEAIGVEADVPVVTEPPGVSADGSTTERLVRLRLPDPGGP